MTTNCPGCRFSFSVSGLTKHLAQTKNPACRAAAAELDDLFDVASSDDGADDFQDQGNSSQYTPVPPDYSDPPSLPQFAGDYFGSYEEDDLEWPVPESDMPDLEVVSDSDEDLEYDLPEPGWEPAPGMFDDCDVPMEYEIPPSIPTQNPTRRQGVEDHLWSDPIIEKFPIPTAGKIFRHEAENNYKHSRQRFSGPNPHQPFATKLEWEISRWAKLRGPSSTAFTELLAIEGVCAAVIMCLIQADLFIG